MILSPYFFTVKNGLERVKNGPICRVAKTIKLQGRDVGNCTWLSKERQREDLAFVKPMAQTRSAAKIKHLCQAYPYTTSQETKP